MYNANWTELYHHGIKGQKHGKRRYQYPDGSLTPEGREHYGIGYRNAKKNIKTGLKIGAAGIGTQFLSGMAIGYSGARTSRVVNEYNSNWAGKEIPFWRRNAYYKDKHAAEDALKNFSKIVGAASVTNIAGGAAILAGLGIIGYGVAKAVKNREKLKNDDNKPNYYNNK